MLEGYTWRFAAWSTSPNCSKLILVIIDRAKSLCSEFHMPNLAASTSIFFLTGIKHLGNPNTNRYSATLGIIISTANGVGFEPNGR